MGPRDIGKSGSCMNKEGYRILKSESKQGHRAENAQEVGGKPAGTGKVVSFIVTKESKLRGFGVFCLC